MTSLFFYALSACLAVTFACVSVRWQVVPTRSPVETERPPPPREFESLQNLFSGDRETASKGRAIYEANCVSCHGPTGKGDGPAGGALETKPLNLAANQFALSDGYLYWRISEGGMIEPFASMMPAWRGLLREEQIWEVITYLRTLEE